MRFTPNPISRTIPPANANSAAPALAAGSAAAAPTSAVVGTSASGASPGTGSRNASSMRSAGLSRIFGTVRPTALAEPARRHSGASATAARFVSDTPAAPGRLTLHRRAGARNLRHMAQAWPVVAAAQSLPLPVAIAVHDLVAGITVHDLPVATLVHDLPQRYAQPVLQRQTGSMNLLHGLGGAPPVPHQTVGNSDAVPDVAERPPLRRDTGVVRPGDFMNLSDSESGSRVRPQ